MGEQAKRRLLRRLDATINDTGCALELGPVQHMTLVAIWALTPRATLNQVIDYIYSESGDIMDVAQVFVAMQRFKKTEPHPLIDEIGKTVTKSGRRPSASFRITSEGKAAVLRTEEHLERLLQFSQTSRKANQMVARKEPPTKPPRRKVGASAER